MPRCGDELKADSDRFVTVGLKQIKDLLELVLVKTPEQLLDVFLSEKLEPMIANELGPRDHRVFSGGSRSRDGRAVSDAAASMIAELGFVGITEDSYYLPSAPRVARKMAGPAGFLVQVRAILPGQEPLRQLPRLAAKAVFFESRDGEVLIHLQECSDYDIPRLGYVVNPVIYQMESGKNSPYLKSFGAYTVCSASNEAQCKDGGPGLFCPFHSAIEVPWPRRSFYLTRGSTFVAVRSLDDLTEPLTLFLQQGTGASRS